MSGLSQALTQVGGTPVLPDDGVVNGLPGFPVPDHGRFPLIGDADGRDLVRANVCFR